MSCYLMYEMAVTDCIILKLGCSNGDAQGLIEAWEMQTWVKHPLSVLKDQKKTPVEAAEIITN